MTVGWNSNADTHSRIQRWIQRCHFQCNNNYVACIGQRIQQNMHTRNSNKMRKKNKSVLFSYLLLCCWYGHCSCCCCCRCHSFCMSWTLARIHTHAHIYSSETASWIPINHAHWICHSEFLRILLRRTSMQHCNIKQNTTWWYR